MKHQFVIVDLKTMSYVKVYGSDEIRYFDTLEEAQVHCGFYELEDMWVMQLMHLHKEPKFNYD